MLKKLAVALAASAFAVTLAAPAASACPGMDKDKTVKKDEEKAPKKVASKTKKATKKESDSKKADKTKESKETKKN